MRLALLALPAPPSRSLSLLLALLAVAMAGALAAGLRGAGTRVGKGRGMRHQYKSRLPVLLHNKDPAVTQYYEHRDVSTQVRLRVRRSKGGCQKWL